VAGPRLAILFSGSAHLAAREAQALLAERYGVGAELWSATSYKALREEAMEVERWNLLHPAEGARVPRVTRLLEQVGGPIVAVSDFMRMVPDQVGRWVPGTFVPLGTDGFGRSDSRSALRRFFEVDAAHVAAAALSALARDGRLDPGRAAQAVGELGVDPETAPPWSR
jgi:pyruvate dehydrogenase E1 component